MKRPVRILPLLLSLAVPLAAAAADWPARPIRWIVPFAAGGPTDGVARAVAQHVSKTLGQPIVLENKPGAEGAIAAQSVVSAPADGYTFLVGTSAVMALPVVAHPAPFQPTDLVPVASFGSFAFGFFTHPGVPAKSMREFVSYARTNPGKLNYASANLGEQIASAQFLRATQVDMVRVPYKGAAQAIPDLLAGRVHVYLTPLVAGLQHAKEGRLTLLATLLPARSPLAPDSPTLGEAGVDGVAVQSRQMLLAPAKTAREIIEKTAKAVDAALADAEVRRQLQDRALSIEAVPPQRLATVIDENNREWAAFARENGVGQ